MALPLSDQRPPLADQGLSYPSQQEFDGPHGGAGSGRGLAGALLGRR